MKPDTHKTRTPRPYNRAAERRDWRTQIAEDRS